MIDTILLLDSMTNTYFQSIWTDNGRTFFDFIAWLGDFWGVVLLSIPFYLFLYYKKRYLAAVVFTSSMCVTVGISTLIKFSFGRARPENMIVDYGGYSFVSGHATMAVLFYGLLVFFLSTHIKSKFVRYGIVIDAIIMILLIILSRLYLSVHWLSDVIAGSILGTLCLIFTIKVYTYLKK